MFPGRIRSRFPRLYIRLSEAMGRTVPGLWGFLAVNYIGKYVLEKDGTSAANMAASLR